MSTNTLNSASDPAIGQGQDAAGRIGIEVLPAAAALALPIAGCATNTTILSLLFLSVVFALLVIGTAPRAMARVRVGR
ncbi:MAG: hypothetical protein KDA73_02650 [Rhodobacteraceae bacterium]|nr:hypothetical protein [Paracoccaceae bacterium]